MEYVGSERILYGGLEGRAAKREVTAKLPAHVALDSIRAGEWHIIYVFVLVALPFLLAIYYPVSAYTIFDPNYRFAGVRNFLDIMKSNISTERWSTP